MDVGISTCPNDTYAFAALIEGRVDSPPMRFFLGDVEELNRKLSRGELDVGKASFHAAMHLDGEYVVLPVGAALGYGVGPLLLSAQPGKPLPKNGDRVLCPGEWTTATLLYRLYFPDSPEPEQTVFSGIMPALERGEADFGVVIHEGRFTYADHGLHRVEDLGELWERETGLPLPLGGILARRSLGEETHREIADAIRRSLAAARRDPASALPQMQKHARELSPDVLWKHVELYVNSSTHDLGDEGKRALDRLFEKSSEAGFRLSPE